MKHPSMKCTRWQWQWLSRMICALAAMFFFVLSAQAQPTITAASNPVVVPNGQASGATTITWKAAPDYTYCEIYLSVDNGAWAEFARGPDGSKSATIKLGSSYTFRMMVYEGPQGTPKIITTLTVTTAQGNPSSPPSGSGGGGGLGNVVSDTIGVKTPGSVNRNVFAISNVRVEPGPRHILIRFKGPPNQVPFVAIGRGAAIKGKDGEWVFGDNLVGGGFVGATTSAAEKAKGEYTFASAASTTTISNGLEPGATYYYIIIIPAGAGRTPYQDTDKFTMLREAADAILPPIGGNGGGKFVARCAQGQLLAGFDLRTGDDVDSIRPICVTAYGPADVGPPQPYQSKFGGDGGGTRQLVCPRDAPIVTGMYIGAEGVHTMVVNNLHLFCGVAATTQTPSDVPAAMFDGPEAQSGSGPIASFVGTDSDTQRCPAGLVAVGINGRSGVLLDAVGLICGAPTLTPGSSGNSENTGTTSSALTPASAAPVKALGRVKGEAPTGPRLSICEAARQARARNSPAAPGLEEKCRADLAAKGAAIAEADPIVAAARTAEPDVLFRQGFDIATGIFGNPALGAQGNTATGPGSLGIRDALSAAGQRGFNASVKLHLSRKY